MGVAQRLKALECDQYIRLSLLHDGFCHSVTVADKGDNASAALRHAVYLRELDIVACLGDDAAKNAACEQCALTAYADDHNILCSHKNLLLIPRVRWRQICNVSCTDHSRCTWCRRS